MNVEMVGVLMSTTEGAQSVAAQLPVAVIGAGPVGLAAAAHLTERGLPVVVLEAGGDVGAAVRDWGHIRTFTPWQYIVDATAEKLLAPTGWTRPETKVPPTGKQLAEQYLEPLAAVLGDSVRLGQRVTAVSRDGLDKSRTVGRADRPFLLRVTCTDGRTTELRARAVIDASGTWWQRNPLGSSGLPALGEAEAAPFLVGPLPDVLGADRARFAGRRTLVVGAGHSAANTLLNLGRLAKLAPGTEVVWAIRGATPTKVYGGESADELAERGQLGSDLHALVDSGVVELVTNFSTTSLEVDGDTVSVVGATSSGERRLSGIHNVAAATGFRPDLAMLSELQLDLDPSLDAPRVLGPLVHGDFHSCGTVAPHGHRELAHPEPGMFIVGMKSYGRAPTFLITTGNEQVRSVAAALAGDLAAADEVQLVLPETGVCSVNDQGEDMGGGCCGAPTPVSAATVPEQAHRELPDGVAAQGFGTGVASGGRLGALALLEVDVDDTTAGSCELDSASGCCS